MTIDVKKYRTTENEVSEVILNRWSTRAFSDKKIDDAVLNTIFEAASWAPSAFNAQPWRFIVAKTEEDRAKFLSVLIDFNKAWAKTAPVLAFLVADKTHTSHALDTGTAWGFLSLQATVSGVATHAMTGLDFTAAKELLNLPENFEVQLAVAIGYPGDASILPESLQERNFPSTRKSLEELLFEGTFKEE